MEMSELIEKIAEIISPEWFDFMNEEKQDIKVKYRDIARTKASHILLLIREDVRKLEKDQKTSLHTFRMTTQLDQEIKSECYRLNVSFSDYIRKCVTDNLKETEDEQRT